MTLRTETSALDNLCKSCEIVLRSRLKSASKRYSEHQLVKKAGEAKKKHPRKSLGVLIGQDIRSTVGELSKEILSASYARQPFYLHREKKPDGNTRFITIHYRLEEKIVERAIYTIVSKYLRKFVNTGVSFCGVPAEKKSASKLGIYAAHREISEALRCSKKWVVKLDIEKFFDKLDRRILLQKLKRFLPDDSLEFFFRDWVNIEVRNAGSDYKYSTLGIPQGSCLSGLMANLYLVEFDKKHKAIEGVHIFRYADDILFACDSEQWAIDVKNKAEKYLKRIGLNFKGSKCDIYQPNEVFSVLGYSYENGLLSVPSERIDDWIYSLGLDFKVIGKVAYRIAKKLPMRKRDITALKETQERIIDKLTSYASVVTPIKWVPTGVDMKKADEQAHHKMLKYLKKSVRGINRVAKGRLMRLQEFRKKEKVLWPYYVPVVARTLSDF